MKGDVLTQIAIKALFGLVLAGIMYEKLETIDSRVQRIEVWIDAHTDLKQKAIAKGVQ